MAQAFQMFEYEGVHCPNTASSRKMIDGARNLRLTPQDVVVAAYPKSGTTWMKYLVHLLMNDGEEEAGDLDLWKDGIRWLEVRWPGEREEDVLKMFAEKPPPRLFCTHLFYRVLKRHVLEEKVKVIVVMRNPKDVWVSAHHAFQLAPELHGTYAAKDWDDFFKVMREKPLSGYPWEHNAEWWQVRHLDNVLVISYEDMRGDLGRVIRKVAGFLGYQPTDDIIQKIMDKCSFKTMKDNPRINASKIMKTFIRKGEVGGWVKYFTEEQNKYVDQQCAEICAPIGLTYQWK